MFGLEFGAGFGRLGTNINWNWFYFDAVSKPTTIQPPGLVNKFGVWWVVRTGEAWRTVARPPENVHSNPFSPLIRTWRLTRW